MSSGLPVNRKCKARHKFTARNAGSEGELYVQRKLELPHPGAGLGNAAAVCFKYF